MKAEFALWIDILRPLGCFFGFGCGWVPEYLCFLDSNLEFGLQNALFVGFLADFRRFNHLKSEIDFDLTQIHGSFTMIWALFSDFEAILTPDENEIDDLNQNWP